TYFPLAIKLQSRLAVVIGGGKVAERKVKALLKAQARIKVISPDATGRLKELARRKDISWIRRRMRDSDIRGADIVVAATNDTQKNIEISRLAKRERIWVNIVDKPNLSDFISPAAFHRKEAIVTVYTDGKDPVLSRDVKNFLKEHWDDFLCYRHRLQNGKP
ncbi:MAG: bifunctional precorrin-2 dehydrogenase/sirohydrochlorin ferrochelatase, partial [Candidatus Omnitrophica bacterium]|nr:bifunctional precorrin-2 dehydrogenase/sirohydrochlorin ferrochelatase [Candidatus Omnitrophota bacterium]